MTQSMTLMIKCGGLPNFLTVAMLAGLMVFNASSASSKAGLAASSFSTAMAFSTPICETIFSALSLTFDTLVLIFSASLAFWVTSANTSSAFLFAFFKCLSMTFNSSLSNSTD